MNVRTFILISIVPIFAALAAANSAALYFAKSRELENDLREQASAAVISAAEYVAARPDLGARLSNPSGRAALTLAMAQIEGLDTIYLLDPKGRCCLLLAGLAPERLLSSPGGAGRWPRVGAIQARASGDHVVTATALLPNGTLLGVVVDADRLLTQRRNLHREALTILAVGVLTGIVVAAIVASWLASDLRQLQGLLAVRTEPEAVTAFRFIEAKDAADAILLLRDNMRCGASLRKNGILQKEITIDPATVLRLDAARRAPESRVELHEFDVAVGTIGELQPGETFALIHWDGHAACVIIRAQDHDPVRASGVAALARRHVESSVTLEQLVKAVEFMKAVFAVQLLVLAWGPRSEGALTIIEVGAGGSLRQSEKLSRGEARLFSMDERVTERAGSLDFLGWKSAADRLRASQNLAEGNGLAASLRLIGTAE